MSNFIRLSVPRQQDVQSNSIVVNANENTIAAANSDACYITPIRNQSGFPQSLYYNPATGEIAYADISGGGGGGGSGGTGPTGPAGSAGPTGATGAGGGVGMTGATGMTGPQGGFGGVTTCYYQDPSSNLAMDPTAGYMYFRTSSTQYAASMLIVDASDCNQTNITEYMKTIMDSPNPSVKGHVRISDNFSGTDNYLLYEINDLSYSGAAPAWFEISVNGVASSSPSPFNPSLYPPNELYLTFARMGDIGAEGPQGVTGPTGPPGSGGGGASPWHYDSNDNFYGPTGSIESSQIGGDINIVCGLLTKAGHSGISGDGNIAIGYNVGFPVHDGSENILIGLEAGGNGGQSGNYNVCIGSKAGVAGGFNNTVLIGRGAGGSAAGLQTGGIVINGTNAASLDAYVDNTGLAPGPGCIIKPIRNDSQVNALYYNTGTGEVTYDTAAGGGGGGTNHWKAATLPDGTNVLEPSANDISGIKLMNTIIQGTDGSGITIGKNCTTDDAGAAAAIGWDCSALSFCSLALGYQSIVRGGVNSAQNGIAMGYECYCGTPFSFVVGRGCYTHAAVGYEGAGCIAIGVSNEVYAPAGYEAGIALGQYNSSTGGDSIAMGTWSVASGDGAFACGYQAKATNTNSVALGNENEAQGAYSYAMGSKSIASGTYSMAMGKDCSSSGVASFACGENCLASVGYAVAMGKNCSATGVSSFACGENCIASDDYSVAMGHVNRASGGQSVAMGYDCSASNISSIAMGYQSTAAGQVAFAAGSNCLATEDYSVAMGNDCSANAQYSVAIGNGCGAEGNIGASVAMGYETLAGGNYSFAMGYKSTASNDDSVAIGNSNTASNDGAVALGQGSTASGQGATSTGVQTTASGDFSLVGGFFSVAGGNYSTALGFECTANGTSSFADGNRCIASGKSSFADGSGCVASGDYSVVFGDRGRAVGKGAVALGTDCSASGWNSIAAGQNSITGGGAGPAIAVGDGCTANAMSIAMGVNCETNGYASVAMGLSCTTTAAIANNGLIALGDGATAAGSAGFVYQDSCSNTFVFDSGGLSGSGQLLINGKGPSQRTMWVMSQPVNSVNGDLSSNNVTFSALPNDNRLISVLAWTLGDGTNYGGGVTFDIPSSEFRSWYWGLAIFGNTQQFLWSGPSGNTGTAEGFFWNAGSHTNPSSNGTGGATNIRYWNGTGSGGSAVPRVPGIMGFDGVALTALDYKASGIKVQWIE